MRNNQGQVQLMNRHGVGDAFGLIVHHDLATMLTWIPVVRADSDIEGIHQVRVALRRMRAATSVFSKAMPQKSLTKWAEEMRWMASALGPMRDLDVFINESLIPIVGKTPFTQGETVLLELTKNRRSQLFTEVQNTLESPRYHTFVEDFSRWLEGHQWFQGDMPVKDRLKMTQGVQEFAIKSLNKRFQKLCLPIEELAALPDVQLHALRIACKKMRYTTDFFSTLFPEDKLRPFIRRLKAIQTILGLMNDVAVLPNTLNPLLEGVTDPDVWRYSGAVLGWHAKGYDDARKRLAHHWSQFLSTPPPWRCES